MKVSLDQYEPMGTQILLALEKKQESEGGVKFAKAKIDQWMKLVKKGSIVPEFELGDHLLLADPSQSIRLKFDDVEYLQTSVHNVIGRVPVAKLKPEIELAK